MFLARAGLWAGTTGSLKGRVTDKATGQPLVGVSVLIEGTQLGAATNAQGEYVVYHVPAGIYRVRFLMIGYRSHVVENVRIVMDLKTTVNAALEAQTLEVTEAIVVTAERPLIPRDVTATAHSVAGSKIEELPVNSFREVLALQPGVTADGHVRGGRTTEVLFLVDGLPIQQAMLGGTGSDLPSGSIVEMTVETGGFNAEYGNAMSGVVNVVTKGGTREHRLWLRAYDDHIGGEETNRASEFELFASGPLRREALTYLISANYRMSDTRWWQDMAPVFGSPIEQNINLVAKLHLQLTRNMKILGQVLFSDWDWHDYEYRWRFNLPGLPPRWKRSLRLSTTLTHTISPRVFYALSLSRYEVQHRMGQGDKNQVDPSQAYQYELPWYYFIVGGRRLWWQDARETTLTLKGDLVAQIGRVNELKSGFEFNYFQLDNELLKYEPQKSYWGRPLLDRPLYNFSSSYHYEPYQGAFYLQDKVDNDIFVANIGLRYDFLNPRAQRPVVEWIPVTAEDYQQEVKGWAPASLKSQLSPRVGVSFPISEHDFLLVNYGYFFQVPLFDYMFTGLKYDLKKGIKALYGNPDLKPERTVAWEMAYKRSFRDNWLLSLTYFDKDITGLVDTKTFLASDSKAEDDGFSQYVNLPCARARGMEVFVEKCYSNYVSGKLSYTLMYAKGFSSSADQGLNYFMWGFAVPNKEHFLSWDQRHTLVVDLFAGVPGRYGLDLVWRWNSPRPYTYYPSRTGYVPDLNTQIEPNNARMRNVAYVDVKAYKEWQLRAWLSLTAYLGVRNLLDRHNVLWIASDGRIGGELRDPSAWDVGRRVNVGLRMAFEPMR
jgi:outer membrane receptor protein involved in Fe transport